MTDTNDQHIVTDDFEIHHHIGKEHFELVFLNQRIEGLPEISLILPDDIVRQMYQFLVDPPLHSESVQ